MKKYLFLVLICTIPTVTYAQCDPDLFEKLGESTAPFDLLKRYSIGVRKIASVPFSARYSYVFTRGNTYGFYLAESEGNPYSLKFTLTNNDGEILKPKITMDQGDRQLYVYDCRTTGIYFFTVYNEISFDGCAVLQLSYQRDLKLLRTDSDLSFEDTFSARKFENQNMLKEFQLDGYRSRYSYVFTKGKYYSVYIERKDQDKNAITFGILNSGKKVVSRGLAEFKLSNGMLYTFQCSETGIYYLEFEMSNPVYALARLSIFDVAKTNQ